MKFGQKQRLIVVVIIGVALILFGVLGMIFHFNVDSKVTNEVSFVLVIIAFALLIRGKDDKK
jgi:uncharacterized membrane protein HdeD (DUF308 family)